MRLPSKSILLGLPLNLTVVGSMIGNWIISFRINHEMFLILKFVDVVFVPSLRCLSMANRLPPVSDRIISTGHCFWTFYLKNWCLSFAMERYGTVYTTTYPWCRTFTSSTLAQHPTDTHLTSLGNRYISDPVELFLSQNELSCWDGRHATSFPVQPPVRLLWPADRGWWSLIIKGKRFNKLFAADCQKLCCHSSGSWHRVEHKGLSLHTCLQLILSQCFNSFILHTCLQLCKDSILRWLMQVYPSFAQCSISSSFIFSRVDSLGRARCMMMVTMIMIQDHWESLGA